MQTGSEGQAVLLSKTHDCAKKNTYQNKTSQKVFSCLCISSQGNSNVLKAIKTPNCFLSMQPNVLIIF